MRASAKCILHPKLSPLRGERVLNLPWPNVFRTCFEAQNACHTWPHAVEFPIRNNPNATRVLDNRSGNINVIQEVEGKTLRITVPRDDMKIISVGPIRPNQVQNLLEKGDFTPLK